MGQIKTIGVIDRSSGKNKCPGGQLPIICAALTTQVASDFAPVWNTAKPMVKAGFPGDVTAIVTDHYSQDGVLGFHDIDTRGKPVIEVFAGPSIESGSTWTSGPYPVSGTLSHEVLELLGDVTANMWAFDDRLKQWAYEACDPVEADSYTVRGVPVSNFVTPDFFNPSLRGGHYDFMGKLTKPFSLSHGGYAIVANLSGEGTIQAEYVFDEAMPEWRRESKGKPGMRSWWREVTIAVAAGLAPPEESTD